MVIITPKMLKKKFVLVGGGIGSFCFYNCLRIHGVPQKDIAVVSPHKKPYHQLKMYCDNIGLTKNERLRSDSGSRPDNFWGFPGYGLSEIIDNLKKGIILDSAKIALQLFCEPVGFGYYSPKAKQVYKSLDSEAKRTGWNKSLVSGKALSLNKLPNDMYQITYKNSKRRKIIANYVHLSLGHGKVKKNSPYKDNKKIVQIKKNGGKVLVVGRGATAAKVVEKLLSAKTKKKIEVISLHHGQLGENSDFRNIKQKNLLSWRLQQFNWPRVSFGGEYKDLSELNIFWKNIWGAPSTAPDKRWIKLIKDSVRNNKYKIVYKKEKADYIIDCTGFDEDNYNSFYKRLISKYNLILNQEGGIQLGKNFEIEKLCGYRNRVFVSGIAARGNNYGPVDSFFGQQFAALSAINSIPEIKKLTIEDSLKGFIKWIKGEAI